MSSEPNKNELSPEKKKIYQQMFLQGTKVASQGNYDYATEMFAKCVAADVSNVIYLQNFISNLQKKYNNNKKGAGTLASFGTAGSKAALKKAQMSKDWTGLIKSGLEVLKTNPWDSGTLLDMAGAAEKLGFHQSELFYYESAMQADVKNVEVNKRYGLALEADGQFDKAIGCWQRVRDAKPNDPESMKMIANLSVKKSIEKGKYEDAKSSQDVRADKALAAMGGVEGLVKKQLTPDEVLQKQIDKDPANLKNYIDLADWHRNRERWKDAEAVLLRAQKISGGDINVQERLEDAQMHVKRENVDIAERHVAEDPSSAAKKEALKKLQEELFRFELDVYRGWVERQPANMAFRLEFGTRLEKNGQFKEAIESYQKARADTTNRGRVLFGLGRCFCQIKQYQLGMNHFKEAVEAIPDTDEDQKKEALRLAGKLALGLKDYQAAKLYLNRLASLDFGYKDVSELLDKVAQLEDTAGPGAG